MATAAANPYLDPTRDGTLDRLDRIAWLTDSALRVPGTNWRFGADSMLSLIPGIGTFLGTGLSAYVVLEALRHGVPPRLLARMGGNIALDTLLGTVPVLGFFADMAFKANQKNLRLLRQHLSEARR